MKITNTTNLEKSGQYFKLVTKDGDLQEQFIGLMECIEKGREVIKKEFRVEVLKC